VLTVPVATWWLAGDLPAVPVSAGRDYAFRPWPIGPAVARAAAAGSLAAGIVTVAVPAWATVRRVLDIRCWAVLLPLAAAGFIAGAGWRVMTAGVIGTHIGAGLVVFFGGPVILILLVWALAFAASLLSSAGRPKNRLSTRTPSEPMPGHLAARGCAGGAGSRGTIVTAHG